MTTDEFLGSIVGAATTGVLIGFAFSMPVLIAASVAAIAVVYSLFA